MEKQLSILIVTSRNLAISESVSDLIPRKDSSAIVMPTSPELGTSNLLDTIQALQNPVADRSYFMLVAQSSGHQAIPSASVQARAKSSQRRKAATIGHRCSGYQTDATMHRSVESWMDSKSNHSMGSWMYGQRDGPTETQMDVRMDD